MLLRSASAEVDWRQLLEGKSVKEFQGVYSNLVPNKQKHGNVKFGVHRMIKCMECRIRETREVDVKHWQLNAAEISEGCRKRRSEIKRKIRKAKLWINIAK